VSIHVEGVNEVDGKQLMFKGLEGQAGRRAECVADRRRLRHAALSLTFQKDETIVAGGKSQYFEMQQAT
jgi:hypothetical protein